MVFSSVDFLFLFLPLFLLTQNFLPGRNLSYLLLSVLFYAVGEGWFVAVVLVSVLFNHQAGLVIDRQADAQRRRWAVGAAVAVNLSALLFFKYTGLLASTWPGIGPEHWALHVHLPLGISFFTFHAISYLVDVYRRQVQAEASRIDLGLYVLMFPQLIAGPILRFHTMAAQLKRRSVTAQHVYFGLLLFAFGMGQKVLIADTLAGVADPLFAHAQALSTTAAWTAAIAYSLQIYFDFCGYSNMAIGLGWLSGFAFMRNFDHPYVSRSITEFWRRWHLSLSRWFRDYVYIPLGGNRGSAAATYRNLVIVFLLCGLWHGAAWTFLVWGAYHGALLVAERAGLGAWLARWPAPIAHAYALLAIVIGWVVFRADGLPQALGLLATMGGQGVPLAQAWEAPPLTGEEMAAFVAAVLLCVPWVPGLVARVLPMPHQPPWPAPASALRHAVGLLLGLAVLGASALKILVGAYSPFIYFRF